MTDMRQLRSPSQDSAGWADALACVLGWRPGNPQAKSHEMGVPRFTHPSGLKNLDILRGRRRIADFDAAFLVHDLHVGGRNELGPPRRTLIDG